MGVIVGDFEGLFAAVKTKAAELKLSSSSIIWSESVFSETDKFSATI